MPERPDLEYIVSVLRQELPGRAIDEVVVNKPIVLRQAVAGDLQQLLVGQRFVDVHRRGHFVRLELDGELELVISPDASGVVLRCKTKRRGFAPTWP